MQRSRGRTALRPKADQAASSTLDSSIIEKSTNASCFSSGLQPSDWPLRARRQRKVVTQDGLLHRLVSAPPGLVSLPHINNSIPCTDKLTKAEAEGNKQSEHLDSRIFPYNINVPSAALTLRSSRSPSKISLQMYIMVQRAPPLSFMPTAEQQKRRTRRRIASQR